MFGIDSSELFIIGLVALLVIGPARLPMAMKSVGQWVAKGRAMSRHLRAGFDTMVREAELEEMQKAWAKHNEAIMKASASQPAAFPAAPAMADPVPLPESADVMAAPPEPAVEQAPALEKPARKRAPKARKKSSDDA
jgi:sec-independent protein translocase protein TatB